MGLTALQWAVTAHAFSNGRTHVKIRPLAAGSAMISHATKEGDVDFSMEQHQQFPSNCDALKNEECLTNNEEMNAAMVLPKMSLSNQDREELLFIASNNDVNPDSEDADILLMPNYMKDDEATSSINPEAVAAPLLDLTETELDAACSSDPIAAATTTTSNKSSSSSVRSILQFAIPAIGVWVCSPLLSLIDTAAVGILAGTMDQAALSPATTLADYSALLLAFMYTATTNLVAGAQEADRHEVGKPRTSNTLVSAIQVSAYVGTALGAALFVGAKVLLQAIMGKQGQDMAVLAPALRYVRIRALGMPAAAIIGSAQAACLGMKDIKAPLVVLLAAAGVNLFGDILFVAQKSPWIGGTAGAAWATVISQYCAMTLFFRWFMSKSNANSPLSRKIKNDAKVSDSSPTTKHLDGDGASDSFKVLDISQGILDFASSEIKLDDMQLSQDGAFQFEQALDPATNMVKARSIIRNAVSVRKQQIKAKLSGLKQRIRTNSDENGEKIEQFSTRGFLEGRFKPRQVIKVPSKDNIADFMPYVVPCTMTSVGRVSMYIAMNYIVASSLGTTDMAAQVIILSFFNCIGMLADSLNMTAQSFVPSVFERPESKERADSLKKITRDFMKAAGIFGAATVSLVACLPVLVKLFTADASVITLVNSVTPLLMINFAAHAMVCAGEGMLLGQKDLSFLGRAFAFFFAVVPWAMLRVRDWAGPSLKLSTLWKVFVGYNCFRCMTWISRILFLERKTQKEASVLSAETQLV